MSTGGIKLEISETVSRIFYGLFVIIIVAITEFWNNPETKNFVFITVTIIFLTVMETLKIKKDQKDNS